MRDIAIGYTGQRRSAVSGHYLLGNGYRGFNPVLKRFSGQDSLSPFGAGGEHGFAYCGGNPSNNTDPSGHLLWEVALFAEFEALAEFAATQAIEEAAIDAKFIERMAKNTITQTINDAGDSEITFMKFGETTQSGRTTESYYLINGGADGSDLVFTHGAKIGGLEFFDKEEKSILIRDSDSFIHYMSSRGIDLRKRKNDLMIPSCYGDSAPRMGTLFRELAIKLKRNVVSYGLGSKNYYKEELDSELLRSGKDKYEVFAEHSLKIRAPKTIHYPDGTKKIIWRY